MASASSDSEKLCPQCEYDLHACQPSKDDTGLTCPECGSFVTFQFFEDQKNLNRTYKGVIEVPPFVVAIALTAVGLILVGIALLSIPGGGFPADLWKGSLLLGLVAMFSSVKLWRRNW